MTRPSAFGFDFSGTGSYHEKTKFQFHNKVEQGILFNPAIKVVRKKWTFDEVSDMLHMHSRHTPVKMVARRHNTSPNAVWKLIQKYKNPSTLDALKRHSTRRNPARGHPRHARATCFRQPHPGWVDFKDVVSWMQEQNMPVEYTHNPNLARLFPVCLDGQHLTRAMTLFKANQKRNAQGLPVFWVHDLSETGAPASSRP